MYEWYGIIDWVKYFMDQAKPHFNAKILLGEMRCT